MLNFLKQNKLVIIILTICLGLYWFYGLMTITKEVTPSVNIPYYNIVVTYPWADAKTIEEQVTSKLEQKYKSINLLKKVTSTTSYNFAVITLEFMTQKNNNDAVNDIKSATDQVYSSLPSDVKYPTIKKVDINDAPMYVFSIASKSPLEILYPRVSSLEDDIKSVKWVSDVSIIGKPVKTIKINFDFSKLASNNLDIWMVIWQLRSSFIKLPTDKKQIQNTLYSFEITTYESNVDKIIQQVKDFEIFDIWWKSLRVEDIATVKLWYKWSQKKSFLFFSWDTVNAISFQVKKVPWYDVNDVTLNLKNKIQEYSKQNLDLQVIEIQSSEKSIKRIYNLFFENFLETWLLALLVILVFLWFRPSLIILLAFVLVYLINFWFFKLQWSSFNNIVSFGLILILWIMIDNLIVVTQWIIVWYRETWNIRWAIDFSLKNYSRPIIFGTLTTIAIFLPMYFGLSWMIGEFMKPFPLTVASNLFISLFVSLVILPVLFATFLAKTKLKEVQSMVFLEHLGKRMWNFFFKSNQTKSWSVWLMSIFWVLFVFAFILMWMGIIKIDFLWNSDSENIWVNMQYTPWISTMQNQEYTNIITQEVWWYVTKQYGKAIEYIEVSIGSLWMQQWQKDPSNISSLSIKLVPSDDRNIKSYVMNEELQSYVKTIKPKYKFLQDISTLTMKWWPWAGSKPIWFYLVGDDYTAIWKYIAKILPLISKIPWVFNLSTSLEYGNGRFKYVLDLNKIKQLNSSAGSIATMFAGIQNWEYEPNWIMIKEFTEFWKDSISMVWFIDYSWNIDDQKIWNIYLQQLLQKKYLEPELAGISKINWSKAVQITADKATKTALWEVTSKINQIIKSNPLPDWVRYEVWADIEEQAAVWVDLWKSLWIGILLMFLILVIQFKNLKYPIIVISSIFLSISWALIILAITGYPFSFPAQIWIFWVLWVWVNQAIIHIEDFKDFYEKDGMSALESFKKSISIRFVPIFLTKLTTILWLLILAFKDELFGSMAIAFIWWLLVSFFITLVYIPAFVSLTSKPYYKHPEN